MISHSEPIRSRVARNSDQIRPNSVIGLGHPARDQVSVIMQTAVKEMDKINMQAAFLVQIANLN